MANIVIVALSTATAVATVFVAVANAAESVDVLECVFGAKTVFFGYFLGKISHIHIVVMSPSAPRSSHAPCACLDRFGSVVLQSYQITKTPLTLIAKMALFGNNVLKSLHFKTRRLTLAYNIPGCLRPDT